MRYVECEVIEAPKEEVEAKRTSLINKLLKPSPVMKLMVMVWSIFTIGCASAWQSIGSSALALADSGCTTMDLTPVVGILNQVPQIFPPIGGIVVGLVPLIIEIAICGMIVGIIMFVPYMLINMMKEINFKF